MARKIVYTRLKNDEPPVIMTPVPAIIGNISSVYIPGPSVAPTIAPSAIPAAVPSTEPSVRPAYNISCQHFKTHPRPEMENIEKTYEKIIRIFNFLIVYFAKMY